MFAFTKSLMKAQHIRRYSIRTTPSGWEVKQEQDSKVVRQSCYQDWHRVERARRSFVIEMIKPETRRLAGRLAQAGRALHEGNGR